MNKITATQDAIDIVKAARVTVCDYKVIWEKLDRIARYLNTVLADDFNAIDAA